MDNWIGTWTASMIAAAPPLFGQGPANWSLDGFADESVRQVVRLSRGGPAVRIRLSNVYGETPLALTGASVHGVTTQALTFDGERSTVIPAAHRRGVRVVGATIMPTGSATIPAFHSERGEAVRRAVNDWIRNGGAFDAVVDLDRVFADPADPQRLRAQYDSGDGVHPGDAGMRAIAEAIDLEEL